jgi:hypothetical protein
MFRIFQVLILISSFSFSQGTAFVEGIITDEIDRPVEDASIFIRSSDLKGTFSNEKGYFKLEVPANEEFVLKVSHIRFKTKILRYEVAENKTKKIKLKFKFRSLGPVTIIARQKSGMVDEFVVIDGTEIATTSGNFEDIIKSGGLGVSSSNELSSGYNVRGGNFEENLIYVNDIEIYRPFLARSGQQEGLSFINSSMVESILFSAGGFDAKYGDKLSSVLDVKYRKPNSFGGSAFLSLLGTNVHLEGISNDQLWTHTTGFRYRTNRYLFGALDTKGDYQPTFADLQTYITYTPTEIWEHSFLGNYALNKYKVVPENRETSFGSINQAIKFTVYFDGQEITEFQTFTGAYTGKFTPNDSTTLKFIASTYRTLQEEKYDIEGQYFLDELERDPGSDNFGDVAFNIGVGGFLKHARNELDATVISLAHKGEKRIRKHNLQWGVRLQGDVINDKLKEWNMTDSAGFIVQGQSDSVGYSDTNQPYQYLVFEELIRAKNTVSTGRASGYVQNTWNLNRLNEVKFLGERLINDSLIKIDTVLQSYSGVSLTTGVRANYWTFNRQLVVSPRAALMYRPNWFFINKKGNLQKRNITFKLATGVYHQPPFYREYRDFDGSINKKIKAQRSIHFVLGGDYVFDMWERPFKLTSELYYKLLNNVIPFDIDNVRIRYYANNEAKAYAGGVDFKLNGEFIKGLESWATLSVMQTGIDLANDVFYTYLNSDGDTIIPGFTSNIKATDSLAYYPGYFARPTDQRVSFSVFFQDQMPSSWNTGKTKWETFRVNMTLIFATGFSYASKSVLANPAYENGKVPRTPNYLRADVGFVKDFISSKYPAKEGSFLANFKEVALSLEIFNLLGIDNTVSFNFIRATNGRNYAVPNRLTSRRINLKLIAKF